MKLNLGCGTQILAGWHNVDLKRSDENVDLGKFPWPWPDNSAEDILASHILEHFDREAGRYFLAECWRVLVPGGVLHLAVPDMDLFIDCMLSGDWEPVGDYHWRRLDTLLGGDDTETVQQQKHRYLYCEASLAWTLEQLGFGCVRRRGPCDFDSKDHAAISLYMDVIK